MLSVLTGGLVANKFICQFLADMLGFSIEVPKVTEGSGLGRCSAGGSSGWRFQQRRGGRRELEGQKKIYKPKMDVSQREKLYAGWGEAVAMLTKGGGDK